MTIPVNIESAGNELKVTREGHATVDVATYPPLDEKVRAVPFTAFFTDSAGSSDMAVDGSTTPVEFSVKAIAGSVIYIRTISIRIGDTGTVTLDRFGGLTELTNGIEFSYITQSQGTNIIDPAIKTNLDFIRLGNETAGFGDGVTAFKAATSGAGEDTYLPFIDIGEFFGVPHGFRLDAGTLDRFSFFVKDNLTGLATFNIKVSGKRYVI